MLSSNRAYRRLTCSGCLRVTTHGQDRYILNTHPRNHFQTAKATSANTNGTHNNRISAQTVRNRLCEGGLCTCRPDVGCVVPACHRINNVKWAHTHQSWLRQQRNSVLFSDKSRFTIYQGEWQGLCIP